MRKNWMCFAAPQLNRVCRLHRVPFGHPVLTGVSPVSRAGWACFRAPLPCGEDARAVRPYSLWEIGHSIKLITERIIRTKMEWLALKELLDGEAERINSPAFIG